MQALDTAQSRDGERVMAEPSAGGDRRLMTRHAVIKKDVTVTHE